VPGIFPWIALREYGAACDQDFCAGVDNVRERVVVNAAVYLNAEQEAARLANLP